MYKENPMSQNRAQVLALEKSIAPLTPMVFCMENGMELRIIAWLIIE